MGRFSCVIPDAKLIVTFPVEGSVIVASVWVSETVFEWIVRVGATSGIVNLSPFSAFLLIIDFIV